MKTVGIVLLILFFGPMIVIWTYSGIRGFIRGAREAIQEGRIPPPPPPPPPSAPPTPRPSKPRKRAPVSQSRRRMNQVRAGWEAQGKKVGLVDLETGELYVPGEDKQEPPTHE